MSGRGLSTKVAVAAQLMLCSGAALVLTPHALAQDAATYPYSYSGRLADASGAPQSGQVDVTASFWSADVGGTRVGQNFDFAAVNLSQGVFTLNFALTPAQIDAIFGDGTEAVFIEITAGGKTYPRQKFSFIPLAMRVPIDNKTLTFEAASGQLGIKNAKSAASGSVLTSDGAGGVAWTAPSAQTTPQNSNALTALVGDVVATGPGSGTAALASVAIPGTATKVSFDVKGRVTSGTTLSASDVTSALGFNPLSNVSINAGAGLSGGQITNGGTISLANTGVTAGSYTRANITVDAQGRITDAQNSAAIVDGDISATANIAQSKIAGLSTSLSAKENAVTVGTTAQYWRGDKTWQPLTTASVAESGTALYYSDTRARASLSSTAPLAYNSSTGGISIAQASGSANGYLSSSDWSAFNGKQDALGFSPLNKAGDTMSGTLNMGSRVITGIASPSGASDAATKAYVDGNLGGTTFDQTAKINDYVVKWNSSGNKYYLAADQTGSAGGGISTFNGLNSANQTLAVGTTGNAPAFSSSSSTHILNIPMASASGVTAGLLSNADYASLNNKVSNVAQGTGIAVATASGTATVSLATTGTAGNYAKVTTDTYGRVTAGTSLSATDIPPISAGIITSGTLAVANGGTGATSLTVNNVLLGNGTNALQTIAPGASGNVLTSNGSTWQSTALPASVTSVSGTAPISVSGTTTPVVAISQASGSANGFLGSSDWTTFNSKQAAGNYISQTTGDLTLSGFASGTATASLASISLLGTSTKVSYDVKGRVTSGTTLSASDIPTLSSNQITTSLGYTPINKAGDTLTGALNAGAVDITNTGNIQMAASKTLALSTNASDPAGLATSDKGKTWFNSATNQIKYWDGSAAVALGIAGSGLSSFNGQTGNTQTLAAPGTSGTAPSWSSASNTHTLNIPMASAAGVTAGLLSNSDYTAFNNKVANVAQGTGVAVSTASGTATVSLATTGTAGNYAKVTTDTYGRVTAGTTLSSSDVPPHSAALITSGAVSVANGGTGAASLTANNVLLGNGTSPLQAVAPGANGNILTSNGTTWVSSAPYTNWTTSGSDVYRSSGNVGIGTLTPGYSLDVNGNAAIGTGAGAAQFYLRDIANASWQLNTTNYQLGFYNNNGGSYSPKMVITNVGNVGIGTTSPSTKTEIYNTATAGHLVLSANDNSAADATRIDLDFRIADQNHTVGRISSVYDTSAANGSGGLRFYSRASGTIAERMRITAGGAVGIGTNSPSYLLHTFGNNNGEISAAVKNSSGSSSAYSALRLDNDGVNSFAMWLNSSTRSADGGTNGATIRNDAGPLRLQSSSGTATVYLATTGNVGIGTTSPIASLDVNGAIYQRPSAVANTSSYIRANAGNVANSTSLNPGITLFDDGLNAYGLDLGYGNSRWRTRLFGTNLYDISFGFHTGNTAPTSQSSFTERMVIRGDSGNVGIGTDAPAEKLQVNGNIRANGLVNQNAYYIFIGGGSIVNNVWSASDQYYTPRWSFTNITAQNLSSANFNTTTGEFIAPVKGLWLIKCALFPTGGAGYEFFMTKNAPPSALNSGNQDLLAMSNGCTECTLSSPAMLNVNDRVACGTFAGTAPTGWSGRTSFSAVLLQMLP